MIYKVENLTMNDVGNNLIDKVANLKINDVGNNLNGVNGSDTQVQFAGDTAGISHKYLLSSRKIGIRHKTVAVLGPPREPSIGTNNQPDLNFSTGFVQALQVLKTPVMQ